MIIEREGKYHVLSEKGKNLGGPYDTREEAAKRLRQVEYFKHRKTAETKLVVNLIPGRSGFWHIYNNQIHAGKAYVDENQHVTVLINKKQQNKGIGSIAFRLAAELSPYNNVYADVRKSNIPSKHALLNAGYQQITSENSQDKFKWTRENMNKAAEFAPGIPYKTVKESPRITSPEVWRLAVQHHKTLRNNPHYDLRIVDDKSGKAYSWSVKNLPTNPGDKVLAVQQPLHTAAYSTFSGTIPKGSYGAGSVELFSQDKIELIKADYDHVMFNVYKTNGDTERYALIKTGDGNWLFHNVTPTRQTRPVLPTEKPMYKSVDLNSIDVNNSSQVLSPKIDGALNVFYLRTGRPIESYSYRTSKKGESKLIDHTFRLPYYKIKTPDAFRGKTVLLGEVFARDRLGKTLSSTDTAARLLSNVWRSRELQEKAPLDSVVFNVLRYNGRDVSQKPYEEKLKILKTITTAIPQLKMPPLASTPEQKTDMLKKIKSGSDPLTSEGVVVYNLAEHTPSKAKIFTDYDVRVRKIFPGLGRLKGKGAGGFEYSLTRSGPIVGRVGSGFTDQQREDMLKNPEKHIGQVARVFSQEQLPSKALRVPSFKDYRAEHWKKSSVTTEQSQTLVESQMTNSAARQEGSFQSPVTKKWMGLYKKARGENSASTPSTFEDFNPLEIMETDLDKRPDRNPHLFKMYLLKKRTP